MKILIVALITLLALTACITPFPAPEGGEPKPQIMIHYYRCIPETQPTPEPDET